MDDNLPLFADDPCAGRHHGAVTSIDAHERVRAGKRATYIRILSLAHHRGVEGITVHEVADFLETTPNGVSGRLTELKAAGRLVPKIDGEGIAVRRRGSAVLVLAKSDIV